MKSKKIFIIMILILLVGAILYHIPIGINKTVSVCTLEGKKSIVTLHVRWQKSFFRPTELKGTIMEGNVTYRSINDMNSSYDYGSFIDNLTRKRNKEEHIPLFVIDGKDNHDLFDNIISLSVSDMSFTKINLYIANGDDINTYYGPAKTAEEAETLAMNFYHD
ncbi:hypothetical protein I5677_12050 [Mobilitalea sibirica]|uniref:Uncharacterized protein n=1 Tax=Mobilitalea sibirica TaxID=1462919 RepID=A0A8J7H3P0_9FIRM|nr:hypothetical protein [Mobilitalea sibirica]MBH1941625.1 hypothetical protein [Mobilitalea sibirica]